MSDCLFSGCYQRAMRNKTYCIGHNPYNKITKLESRISSLEEDLKKAEGLLMKGYDIVKAYESKCASQNELIKEAVGSIDWIGQTLHRAHHDGEFSKCEKNTCDHANKFVAKLRESVKGEG